MISSCGSVCWVDLWMLTSGEGGNIMDACWRASLIVFGMCLYMDWNSLGVSMVLVSGF